MAGWSGGKTSGGGGTTDATARAQAAANANNLSKIYKAGGDSVPAGSTVLVLRSDGTTAQYTNNTASAITIPATATDANILAANLTQATGGADARINAIYKVAGDVVSAGSEVFVMLSSGTPVNFKNPTAGNLTVPASPTQADVLAAGFSLISSAVNSTDVIKIWNTSRTAWAVDAKIDFTVAEPALIAGNLGKIYWSGKTGNGSKSTSLVFDQDAFYQMFDDGAGNITWSEYKPDEGFTVALAGRTYLYTSGAYTLQPTDKHQHPFLTDVTPITSASIIYRVVTGSDKLWKQAKANPDTTMAFTDPAWPDNWVEAFPASTGVKYVNVVDNDTLTAGQYSVSDPTNNVVVHLNAPAPAANSWFSVVNVGQGVIDVGGTQIIGNGALEYTANKAGTAWVLTSREGTVGAATDNVALASLPADTWTAAPASAKVPDPAAITVRDSAGLNITHALNTRKTGTGWELQASLALTDLTITIEA